MDIECGICEGDLRSGHAKSCPGYKAKKITTEDAVRALKARKGAHPASAIANDLGSTSRGVATALRKAVKDGRVSWRFKGGIALYRFVRLRPNTGANGPRSGPA